jgi:hypothetical protein
MFPAGFEPATLRVWGARDNHYTTETSDTKQVKKTLFKQRVPPITLENKSD